MTMRIVLTLHGDMPSMLPQLPREQIIDLREPLSIGTLIESRFGLDPMIFASIVVNGTRRHPSYQLTEDAHVLLVLPLAGG